MIAPTIHALFPFRKVFRIDLRQVVVHFLRAFANWPEKSPLSIVFRGKLGQRSMLFGQAISKLLVITSLFDGLMCGSCLIAELWVYIFENLTCVEFVSHLLKVPFHHVDVVLVLFMINTWVSNDGNTELMEALCDFFAFKAPGLLVGFVKVGLKVNNRNIFEYQVVCANRFHERNKINLTDR